MEIGGPVSYHAWVSIEMEGRGGLQRGPLSATCSTKFRRRNHVKRRTRRDFLKTTAMAGIGFWVSGKALTLESKSPNEKLNIGVIGTGGKGYSDLKCVESENIVALCDVDESQAEKAIKE